MAPVAWLHALLLVFLIVVFPLWDRAETRRLKRSPTTAARIRIYRLTIGWLWCTAVLLVGTAPPDQMWKPPRSPFPQPAGAVLIPVMVGLLAGLLAPIVAMLVSAKARASVLRQLQTIDFMLPGTARERAYFAAVSISAGICEEIIFRGFLIRYLDRLLARPSIGWAIAAAALIFGLDHGYQGWRGMLTTTALALLLTFLYYASSGLWLPMLVHALVDLRILLVLRQAPVTSR
jgi:membrane protease YdiL (CAAX protease family)